MRVTVIGAGVGGLAAAIRLGASGHAVTVFEANEYPGGKLHSIEAEGYRFDAGPSLFTLPDLISDLFRVAGKEIAGRFAFHRKEVGCHYFFTDGTFLRAYSEPTALAAEAEKVLGVPALRVAEYLEHAARTYERVGRLFLERPLKAWGTWLNGTALNALFHAADFDLTLTLHEANTKRIGEPRLVQYFDRMATYNGSSPFRAPGILSMIPHLEHNVGTYIPEGGMIAITRTLFELAKEVGVNFEFGRRVTRIVVDRSKVIGVESTETSIQSELVVCNMDVVAAYQRLMPEQGAPKHLATQERSSSAVIFYWGIRRQFPQLELHNVFFAEDYEEEFRAIFDRADVAADPTVYVCVTAKDIPGDAPSGCENWFVMVNAPANVGQDWDGLIARVRQAVLRKLERHLGVPIEEHIEVERLLDPRSIEARTSSYQGALYGASSNSKWAAFLRHPNASPAVRGLYFCGGSVHPGGGIPLCLQSARIVSEQIREQYGS